MTCVDQLFNLSLLIADMLYDTVTIVELSLSITEKKEFVDRFVDILCTLARR